MIEALSIAVPKNVIDRSHFPPEQLAQFERVTGIKKTRRLESGFSLDDLTMEAVKGLRGKFEKEIIGNVIMLTQSPQRFSPCNAMTFLEELGVRRDVPVFDVNQSCTAFLYGLYLTKISIVPSLIICADSLRFGVGLESLIFSDAACAAVVTPTRIRYFNFLNDPSGTGSLYAGKSGAMKMDGAKVSDFVVKNVPKMILDYEEDSSHILVQHQPNLSMMKLVEKKSGFGGRSLNSIEEYGNMSMVSVPITLAHNEEKILGKKVLLAAYGAGFSAVVGSVYWEKEKVSTIKEI